jgi:hypothetical protein
MTITTSIPNASAAIPQLDILGASTTLGSGVLVGVGVVPGTGVDVGIGVGGTGVGVGAAVGAEVGVGVGVFAAATLMVTSGGLLPRNESLAKKLMPAVPTNPVYGVKITSMVVAVIVFVREAVVPPTTFE